MWKKIAPLLIVLSVALNIAFVSIWAVHTARVCWLAGEARQGAVWCPLHRRLKVTDDQWRQIEPRLLDFQEAAREVRADVTRHRTELLDLIAAEAPDRAVLRAKQAEILAGQSRMQELVIDYLLGEKNVLTPVQQRELFDIMRRRSGCSGQGHLAGSWSHR